MRGRGEADTTTAGRPPAGSKNRKKKQSRISEFQNFRMHYLNFGAGAFVVDWRSSVSSRTQWHDLVEDRGVQLGLGLENRGAPTACVSNDARDWTHFVLVVFTCCVCVGGWGALACFSICYWCPQLLGLGYAFAR